MTRKNSHAALSRRAFLRLAASAGGAGLLAACGAAQPSGTAATAQPAAQAPAQGGTAVTEITFWWWDDGGKIWAEEYSKVNPQIKVNFVNTPFADAHEKLLTSFASGSGAPDVASIEIGRVGGFTSRQGLNAGIALIAHGEFTIIIAQLASQNPAVGLEQRRDLAAFAGLYVLVTATLGIVLMKESKRIGRAVFPTRTLAPDP